MVGCLIGLVQPFAGEKSQRALKNQTEADLAIETAGPGDFCEWRAIVLEFEVT